MVKLVLVSTPLQALIAQKLLGPAGSDDYDVVYSAQSDLESHRLYFQKLADNARQASYVAGGRGPATLRFLARRFELRSFFRATYDVVHLASIDSQLFRSLLTRHRDASVVSFDDGAANVFSGSRFFAGRSPGQSAADLILRCQSMQRIRRRIEAHYTLYEDQPNIVDVDRLRPLRLWEDLFRDAPQSRLGESTSFFIGQPFSEAVAAGALDASALAALRGWLSRNAIDHYLVHPREMDPLLGPLPAAASAVLAEEKIFELAAGRRPRLHGWFSTVLLNIPPSIADKVYLSVGRGAAEEQRIKMMQAAGCSIEYV
jgi:hypothetical protein